MVAATPPMTRFVRGQSARPRPGRKSLEIIRDAGLPMAFGSDLLGGLRKYHCMEFELLA